MICNSCNHAVLPGGKRCSYCGTRFGIGIDFDFDSNGSVPPESQSATDQPSTGRRAGLGGLLLLLLFKGKFLLSVFKLGKLAVTLSSMLIFMWAEARYFGWKFGVGFALCILVHEMGHVYVNRRHGIPSSAPMFIPFVGALITVRRFPQNPVAESECGAGGPAAGLLASLACMAMWPITRDPFWMSLAGVSFAINLFNMTPFPPLDGSRIASVFGPAVWNMLLLFLALVALKIDAPTLWFIIIMGLVFRFGVGATGRYQIAPVRARWRMALVYVLLAITLSVGMTCAMAIASKARTAQGRHSAQSTDTEWMEREPESTKPIPAVSSSDLSPAEEKRLRDRAELILTIALWSIRVAWCLGVGLILAGRTRGSFARNAAIAISGCVMSLVLLKGFTRLLPYESSLIRDLHIGWLVALPAMGILGMLSIRQARHLGEKSDLTVRLVDAMTVGLAVMALAAYGFSNWGLMVVLMIAMVGINVVEPWRRSYWSGRWSLMKGSSSTDEFMLESARLTPDALRRQSLSDEMFWRAIDRSDGDTALRWAEISAAQGTQVKSLAHRAFALVELGRFDEALKVIESMMAPSADDPLAHHVVGLAQALLSRISFYKGWHDDSIARGAIAREVLVHFGGSLANHPACSAALSAAHSGAGAVSELNWLRSHLQNSSALSWLRCAEAVQAVQSGKSAEALQRISEAQLVFPESPCGKFHRVWCEVHSQLNTEAESAWRSLAGELSGAWKLLAEKQINSSSGV